MDKEKEEYKDKIENL